MEPYKTGFNKSKFEQDHFGFKRGSSEKYFHGWDDVRYHFGLTPYSCSERELEDGNMGKRLYDELCHLYGEDGMAKYFPSSQPQQKRVAILHNSVGSAMAAMADGKRNNAQPKGIMTEKEIDALAALM